jgi:uncharacterized protein YjeT (DUF2065 family)
MVTKLQEQETQRQDRGSREAAQSAPQPSSLQIVGGGPQGGNLGVTEERLASALGWFSIGLGLAEIVAPRALSKLIGVKGNHDALLRLFGLREMMSGLGILTQPRPAAWVWGRVGGDALDLACLGMALASPDSDREKVLAALASVAGVTVADVICAIQLSGPPSEPKENGER